MTGGIELTTLQLSAGFGLLQFEEYYDDLVYGFFMTMGLYLFALFFGLVLAIIFAVVRHYGGAISSRIATAYIEFFRGTPLLVQILAVVYLPNALNAWLTTQGIPPIDFNWQFVVQDPWGVQRIVFSGRILLCAITLGLNSAAYQAEYFRGAMGSISSGQPLAATSIGMTKWQGIRHVMLPQSLRRAIPAWSNEAVYLPKYTTVCYFVGVEDLFAMAKLISTRTYQVLPVYALIAIIFLVLITFISWLLNYIYSRIKIPGI